MANATELQIPPPKYWEQFEDLTLDLFVLAWGDKTSQKNGRKGQSQYGVDVYGIDKENGNYIGIQCKGKDNYTNQSLTESELINEVEKAKSFEPKLNEYIIFTTTCTDVNIQKKARLISEEHKANGLFRVNVFYWEKIISLIEMYDKDKIILSKYGLSNVINTDTIIEGLNKFFNETDLNLLINHAVDEFKKYQFGNPLSLLEMIKTNFWNKCSNYLKFRVLANIGNIKISLSLGEGGESLLKEGATLLIQSFEYNRDDEKGLYQGARGYFLLKDFKKASKLANKCLEKNPTNAEAYELLLYMLPDDKDFCDIENEVPIIFKNNDGILQTLGDIAYNKKLIDKSIEYLKQGINKQENISPYFISLLGNIIIIKLENDKNKISALGFITEDQKILYEEALSYFEKAREIVKNSDYKSNYIDYMVNIGTIHSILGNKDFSIKIFNEVLDIDNSNLLAVRNLSTCYFLNGEFEKSIEVINNSGLNNNELNLTLSKIYMEKSEYHIAKEILKKITNIKGENIDFIEDYNIIYTIGLLKTKDYDNAILYIENLLKEFPNNAGYLLLIAQSYRLKNDKIKYNGYLKLAEDEILKSNNLRDKISLAEECYFINNYEKAFQIYDNLPLNSLNKDILWKYINSGIFSYNNDYIKKSLEYSIIFEKNFGLDKNLCDLIGKTYANIGDLNKAIEIYERYILNNKTDLEASIFLNYFKFFKGDLDNIKEFLNIEINNSNLSQEVSVILLDLYYLTENFDKGIKFNYYLLDKYKKDCSIKARYIFHILSVNKNVDLLKKYNNIVKDCYFVINDEGGNSQEYIFGETLDEDMPLGEKVKGKTIGDKVKNNYKEYTILKVQNKYLWRHNLILNTIENECSNSPIMGIFGNDINKFISISNDILENRKNLYKHSLLLYKEGKITIGVFSYLLGTSIIEGYYGLINEGFIICSNGINNEYSKFKKLGKDNGIAIDIIGILSIFLLSLEDVFFKFYKFFIPQSTIDLLNVEILKAEGNLDKEYFSLFKKEGKIYREEQTREKKENYLNFLKKVKDYLLKYTNIVPCRSIIKYKLYDIDKKDNIIDIIGRSSFETILISQENNYILFTDDERLSNYAIVEHGVDSIHIHLLLINLYTTQGLSKEDYYSSIIKLIKMGYTYISIDVNLLDYILQNSEYKLDDDFKLIIKILNPNSSDINTSIDVLIKLCYCLRVKGINKNDLKNIINFSILSITENYDKNIFLNILFERIKKWYITIPQFENDILSIIES